MKAKTVGSAIEISFGTFICSGLCALIASDAKMETLSMVACIVCLISLIVCISMMFCIPKAQDDMDDIPDYEIVKQYFYDGNFGYFVRKNYKGLGFSKDFSDMLNTIEDAEEFVRKDSWDSSEHTEVVKKIWVGKKEKKEEV